MVEKLLRKSDDEPVPDEETRDDESSEARTLEDIIEAYSTD